MDTAIRPRLSEISRLIVQSEIRSMSVECDRVRGVNLAQGVCDTEVPGPVLERAASAIHEGYNTYTRLDGIVTLREAIAAKARHYNGIYVDPEREILVTSGATGAFYAACLALFNPGEEVLLFEPLYGYHVSTLKAQRLQPVIVPLAEPNWAIDFEVLSSAITAKTRAIVINTPSNPCGKVFSRAELEHLAAIVLEHDLLVITDEIYEYFLYDGAEHISFATLPGMAERTITISGLSKTFSITGWRIGYLIANPSFIAPIGYFHDLTYVCAPSPFQHGAAAGLIALPDEYYLQLASDYQGKRDMLCAALSDAALTPCTPAGAYYVLADSSSIPGETAALKARKLLADTGVAAVAGTAFLTGNRGDNILRFCFAKRAEDLERACEQLRNRPRESK
jgi:aminotransferase